MDYRQLLKAYLRHVGDAEGTNFLGYRGELTKEQRAELNDLYDEAVEENF